MNEFSPGNAWPNVSVIVATRDRPRRRDSSGALPGCLPVDLARLAGNPHERRTYLVLGVAPGVGPAR